MNYEEFAVTGTHSAHSTAVFFSAGIGKFARILTLLAALVVAGTVHAAPVNCQTDPDPAGAIRVFPEGNQSVSFLSFDDFECGINLLAETYPNLLEIVELVDDEGDSSPSGLPVYDIVMTNESIPADQKEDLFIISSIHGNEIGGREGAARAIEDMVRPEVRAAVDATGSWDWVDDVLDQYIIHWTFPNPEGWNAFIFSRGNSTGRDLNRNQPVKGWISPANGPLDQPESRALNKLLIDNHGKWYLGTDNHGQGPDTYAAAGLQIVGEFNFQKSETLARFADGITGSMEQYDSGLAALGALKDISGLDLGPYHWGTLYDMLGYSASGSVIDYYNTIGEVDGTGFATELTASQHFNTFEYPGALNQVWINSIRAINFEMFKQAIDPVEFTFPVGGYAAYVFDPLRVRSDDANGVGFEGSQANIDRWGQADYDVSRMKYFEDLDYYSDRGLTAITVEGVLDGSVDLYDFDSVILNENPMPGNGDPDAWFAALTDWVAAGGNLILTDAALLALDDIGVLEDDNDVSMTIQYVGAVDDFPDESHHLNQGLRGIASQTYDTVPIGYSFGGSNNSAPNWRVTTAAWQAAGGYVAGTRGNGYTIYGEVPQGEGVVRILGALLPNPTEEYYHPFGLQNYAVTYTGYTLVENMLVWNNVGRNDEQDENYPPSAVALASPNPAVVNEPVTFDGGQSVDDHTPTNDLIYEWDFDNNGTYDATGKTADYTFTMAGTYTVALRVTDSGDPALSDIDTVDVTVLEEALPLELATFYCEKLETKFCASDADSDSDDSDSDSCGSDRVKAKGLISLPIGVDYRNVAAEATASFEVAENNGFTVESPLPALFFEVKGSDGEHWEYRGSTPGIEKFDIDWKGARFRYDEKDVPVEFDTEIIGADHTVLEVEYDGKDIDGPFTIDFAGQASVTVDPLTGQLTPVNATVTHDDMGKRFLVEFQFPLVAGDKITLSGMSLDTEIEVSEHYTHSTGKFSLKGESPEAPLEDGAATTPTEMLLNVGIGTQRYAGECAVTGADIDVHSKYWKAKN